MFKIAHLILVSLRRIQNIGDPGMAELCFTMKDSNPPVCGVHNVPLIQRQSLEGYVLSELGDFAFLACPVSRNVDSAPQRRSPD
jgi:hypothetical protein